MFVEPDAVDGTLADVIVVEIHHVAAADLVPGLCRGT